MVILGIPSANDEYDVLVDVDVNRKPPSGADKVGKSNMSANEGCGGGGAGGGNNQSMLTSLTGGGGTVSETDTNESKVCC